MDIWVVSSFFPIMNKVLWTLMFQSWDGHMLSWPFDTYIGIELLNYMVDVCLTFENTVNLSILSILLSSKAMLPFCILSTSVSVFQLFYILASIWYSLFSFVFSFWKSLISLRSIFYFSVYKSFILLWRFFPFILHCWCHFKKILKCQFAIILLCKNTMRFICEFCKIQPY